MTNRYPLTWELDSLYPNPEKLSWYDLQAPLPTTDGSTDSLLSYDTVCDRVLDALNAFDPGFGEFSRMAIEQRWVEAEDRGGKRQGGFSIDMPTRGESRIFMTFTGSVDSMSTLAHELGLTQVSADCREEHRKLLGYLRGNVHGMDYPRYVANGWQIGNGTVEAACKTVVCQRMKESGMRWRERGTNSLSHLRALYRSQPVLWRTYWNPT